MATEPKNKLSGFWPKSTWKLVSQEELKPLRALYRQARFLDAYELSKKIGPLQTWMGKDARNFAADLAGFLTGFRLSDWLEVTSYRHTPQQEEAQIGYACWLQARRGPLLAWWFLDKHPLRPDHSANYKFQWLSRRASIALHFRDFELAKKYADETQSCCERPERFHMEESFRFRAQDRLEDALAAARQAHAIHPTGTAALQQITEILLMQKQDEECLSFLKDALEKTQFSYLLSLKIRLLIEQERFSELKADFALYEKWTPLIELDGRNWLNAGRADACYQLDRLDEAIEWANKVDTDFHRHFVERLRSERRRARVRLPVGFIRQDHNTCGPATLTALANFWGLPADHGEVAESICYDGTPDYLERKWVEENGFFVREFKVTWDAARQLIDLGIPFTLVTSSPSSSHLQAVIGYDVIQQTLLIRDPGQRDLVEFDWKKTEEFYQAIGPRGLAFVPNDKWEILDHLDLPEASLYDRNYDIRLALHHHRRDEAIGLCLELERKFPDQRLAIIARRHVADYDDNVPEQLACAQKLLKLFPEDERHSLSLLFCLREVGRREERLSLLSSLIRKKDCDPLLWTEFAVELLDDSREQELALKYLKKAHGSMPWHAQTAAKIADILWNRGEIAPATDIYRFVASMDHKREGASKSYFIVSRLARRVDEAIHFLKARFHEYGAKSPDPIRTLFYALEQLNRIPEAFSELEKAMTMRPKDGELLCYSADIYRRYGKKEQARRFLAQAERECPRSHWLRTSALLAQGSGDLPQALQFWKDVAALEPLAQDAHREVADLLSKTQGKKEALSYLRSIYDTFPFNLDISRLLLSYLENENREEAISLCRTIVKNHPANAWAARELASQLDHIPAHLEEAMSQGQLARDLEPRAPAAYNILGTIYRKLGRLEEAREAYREAIRLDVDNRYAIERLIDLNATQEEKRKDLLFVREQLVRQVVFGDGLLEFRQQAKRALPPEEVLGYLQEAKEARPDLWQAWSSLTYQLSHMGLGEALAIAQETAKRFPLNAGSWRNLGDMYGQQDKWVEAAQSLEKAYFISSDWISVITELSEAYQRQGDPEKAQAILESALRNNPTSSGLRGHLADLLYHKGAKTEALQQVRLALELDPQYEWGLKKLRTWGTPEECLEMCRSLTRQRPGEAHSWWVLADNLDSSIDLLEMSQALDRAITLEPQNADAYDLKALALTENKRFEEALAVCRPLAWGGYVPLSLRGRAAWIENARGHRKKAIERMETVVADDSTFYWGWEKLSDWLLEDGRAPEAVKAADHMVQLKPGGAQAFGYRADAKLKQGDRSGAIADLRRAHLLDPDYGYATWTLFDLILDDEEYQEAKNLFEDARRCSNPGKLSAAEIRFDLNQKHIVEALSKLKSFGASSEAAVDTLQDVQKEFQKHDVLDYFDRALEEMVSSKTVSGPALYIWANRQGARGRWNMGSVIDYYLQHDKKAARFLVDSYLNTLGDKEHFEPYAFELYRRHRAWIIESTHSWALMGYALYWGRKYEWCTKWMSNWKEMDGVQRWMLMNLNRALRNLGRETEAEQINRRVLEIEPGNSFANLYLAFDLACKGDAQTAETLLQNVKENDLQNDYKLYLMLTREIVGFLKTDRAHRVPFWQARDRLRRHRRALAKPSWEFRRAYFLGLARLAGLSRQPNAFYYRLSTARILGSLFHASDQAWFFLRRLKVLLFWRPGRFINP